MLFIRPYLSISYFQGDTLHNSPTFICIGQDVSGRYEHLSVCGIAVQLNGHTVRCC